MPLVILNVFGWFVAHWRLLLTAVGVGVLLLTVALVWNRCKARPKFDQVEINKINSQNKKERETELQKVIEDNSSVIKTVDERTEITNINVVERNREIDAKVKAADRAIQDAKSQGRDVTQEELECLLIPDNCS
jgi:hypothetical protein